MHILSQNPLYAWLTKPIEHLQQIIQRPSNKVDLVNDTVKFISKHSVLTYTLVMRWFGQNIFFQLMVVVFVPTDFVYQF